MANLFTRSLIPSFFSLCFLSFLLGCGLPSSDDVQSISTPSNLVWVEQGSQGNGEIVISFSAENPEIFFTGFNVYMSSNSEAELKTQHRNHVINQKVDTNISRDFIVRNKVSKNYPTIQDSDGGGIIEIRSSRGTVRYTIEKAPNDQTLSGNYWIAVSAYSSNNTIESGLTNIVSGVRP